MLLCLFFVKMRCLTTVYQGEYIFFLTFTIEMRKNIVQWKDPHMAIQGFNSPYTLGAIKQKVVI